MPERIYIYDTTLRDGAQMAGVNWSLVDKLAITKLLDQLGVDYIEGGWPSANPTDDSFFTLKLKLEHAKLGAFGMTRRSGKSTSNDPGLAKLLDADVDVVTLVGKTSATQVEKVLGISPDENLKMIGESVAEACTRVDEVMFDAEQFFDGFVVDPGYAIACLREAYHAGAQWLVLCDTNGGRLPHEIGRIVEQTSRMLPDASIGIHAHNDTENAVANTLVAVQAGARQVQGTINGIGERCGNANLVSLLPTLMLKLNYETGISEQRLVELTDVSRALDARLHRSPLRQAAYVGADAFAHKAGLHVSAVAKSPAFYEHIVPERVGNERRVLISNQAGRSNLLARIHDAGLDGQPDRQQLEKLLATIKKREAQGYSYEHALASFELLARKSIGEVFDQFTAVRCCTNDERHMDGGIEKSVFSITTIDVEVGEHQERIEISGVDNSFKALESAMRNAFLTQYPCLASQSLVAATTHVVQTHVDAPDVSRVSVRTADGNGETWITVGVSSNSFFAACHAIADSLTYSLLNHPAMR